MRRALLSLRPSNCFLLELSSTMRTTAAATMNGKRSPHRAAISLSSRPLLKTRVALHVEKSVVRLPVVFRATAVQPLDPTTELFATLSSIAAVDGDEIDGDVLPAVAFTSSSSSSLPSTSGRGLVATRPLARREVALRVPGSICLVVDYSPRGSGLSLPETGEGKKQSSLSSSVAASSSLSPSSSSSWPRTSAAVAKDPSTPWDFLLALALLDAVSGDGGGEWWESFAEGVLPLPSIGEEEEEEEEEGEEGEEEGGGREEGDAGDGSLPPSLLTLPLCLPQRLLALAGHRDLERAALEQQRRLAERYPALAAPASASSDFPTMMQWALACVRSRAFSLSESGSSSGGKSGGGGGGRGGGGGGRKASGGGGSEKSEAGDEQSNEEEEEEVAFAFVPLLDCANHSQEPAAAYRPVWKEQQGDTTDGGGRRRRLLEAVELVMLRAVPEGEEVTISYFAGAAGATNRRLFSLYGFVPAGGNPGDRVEGLEDVIEGAAR